MANALHDIHLPPPVSWWPVAPGYIMLACVIICALAWLFFHHSTRRSRQIKHEALQQLAHHQKAYANHASTHLIAAQISLLLKQVALVYYPRTKVASLQGDAWLHFLAQTSKKLDVESARSALLEAPFSSNTTLTLDPLFVLARAWIKQRSKKCLN